MNILQILKSLEATSSRLKKEEILKKNTDNELLKAVLKAALNPLVNYYIRKIPPYTPATKNASTLEIALKDLNNLSMRKVTGNDAIKYLSVCLSSLNEEDAEVIERVIAKDLKCGVQESTVNKIWKDLIPSYPCMLASGFDSKLVEKILFPAAVQTKFDGMRFNAIVKNNAVEFRSRNGKLINLLGELDAEFLDLAGVNNNIVFDGELLVVDENSVIMSRQEGNGILNKAVKGTIKKDQASRVIAVLWDAIPYQEFVKGKSSLSYTNRLTFFTRKLIVLHKEKGLSRIRSARTHIANNLEEVQNLYNLALQSGEEGIILKDLDGVWEDKRVKHQIKFKNELEADLICKDWMEGTGKNAGKLGALLLQSANARVNVSVGTGFTDEMRSTLTKKDVLNKIITVKYNSLITDKNNNTSLFLPVFVEIREDKTEADEL
jgi:ATP-dependent DNA ligase